MLRVGLCSVLSVLACCHRRAVLGHACWRVGRVGLFACWACWRVGVLRVGVLACWACWGSLRVGLQRAVLAGRRVGVLACHPFSPVTHLVYSFLPSLAVHCRRTAVEP